MNDNACTKCGKEKSPFYDINFVVCYDCYIEFHMYLVQFINNYELTEKILKWTFTELENE